MSDARLPAAARAEMQTRERCYVTELLNDPAAPQVSLALCRVEPGVTTELHRLSVDEWYVISAGFGWMEVGGGDAFAVAAGDAVVVPAHESQRVGNTGSDDLVFQCICIPRFTPDCYEAIAED